ncbi:metallophosphoesterase family protein [Bradymonas sediminis]|uniref:DNA repair exonuclease n=1 Tax=Bradymonas sediminis TaxID=1548548 RepID=A0A2Z4FLP4_9DELT|nr:DNA repair exonuclease [Bradymonas sediminis]AWV89927.1 DNA repair exonuclease [Bradymonas sediminis]TDP62149.1 DNA repair exonuclease SbcCD nuclease subunit [Bradymonas sediminis]
MPEGLVKILCAGDLHLGRYPSRVDGNPSNLSVAHIWARTVECAIDEAVDLVVLTGDVVDRENRFFEAIGPLEQGLRRLGQAGIPTFAVSGNHDFDVLPRVADAVDSGMFYLLGRGGSWESRVFERDGKPILRLVGWSFPRQHYPQSPLEGFAGLASVGTPTIGILHADLDQRASRYAPVMSSELGAYGFSAWLLGHIHRPTETRTSGGSLVLYPGSPQPLDPGEPGVHGPWIVEVSPDRPARAYQVALASVRYAGVEVDLGPMQGVDDFEKLMMDAIRGELHGWIREARASAGSGYLPERAMIRLKLVGSTPYRAEIERLCARVVEDFELPVDDIMARVEKIEIHTRPALDLREIARGNDPPALLARLLVELEAGEVSAQFQPLFAKLRHEISQVHRANAFGPLLSEQIASAEVDDAAAHRLVQVEGVRLLEELLSQKYGADAHPSVGKGGRK